MTLHEILRKAGFSEKESDVYRALLNNESLVASEIAEQAGLNRSTTYVILETLLARGIISSSDAGAIRSFGPADPKQLIAYFERASTHYKELATATRSSIESFKKTPTKRSSEESTYGAALSSLGGLRSTGKQNTKPLNKALTKSLGKTVLGRP